MKIVITGVDEYLKELDRIEKMPVEKWCVEILKEAEQIVRLKYSLRASEGNVNFDTEVTEIENGAKLTAYGVDVGFLEFGAGVFTDTTNDFIPEVGFPVHPGSWSESHPHHGDGNPNVRYFAKNGFWWWSNIRYTGLAPTRGMQTALDYIRNNIEDFLERKIKEWIES